MQQRRDAFACVSTFWGALPHFGCASLCPLACLFVCPLPGQKFLVVVVLFQDQTTPTRLWKFKSIAELHGGTQKYVTRFVVMQQRRDAFACVSTFWGALPHFGCASLCPLACLFVCPFPRQKFLVVVVLFQDQTTPTRLWKFKSIAELHGGTQKYVTRFV